MNVEIPCWLAYFGEVGEQDRRDAPALPGVGDQERHLGRSRSIRT